jgi:diguanylate cyclase (GGDEF)-like protein/PAS domain S-box-containing protein
MLVEDDDLLRERLLRILKREVSTVQSYSKPSEALSDLKSYNPDIIITDIKMPGMSGLEMVRIIRHTYPNIPVIIASAFSEPEMFLDAIDLKVENYVVKPINIDMMVDKLKTIANTLNISKLLKEKESLLNQYKHIVDISAYITITDKNGIITYVNDKFYTLSGYNEAELIGHSHAIMRSMDIPKEFYKELWRTVLSKKVWQGIIKNINKNGMPFYTDTTIAPVLDASGEIEEFISIKLDITDLIISKQKLKDDLVTDRLTGLSNRLQLVETLKEYETYTLLIIDIDHFKDVNLLFGIHFGDMVLQYLANAIQAVSKDNEVTIYRIASDEFIILAKENEQEALANIAHNLRTHINATPFTYDNVSFEIDFSCGLLYCDTQINTPIEEAQNLVTEAKQKRQFIKVFDKEERQQKEYEENFAWTQKIKSALNEDRLKIFFQPLYDTKLNKITKFECLIRLIEPDGEVVPPFKFLKAAKRSRHYRDLTRTVITQACETFKNRSETFSINLSIEDLSDDETLDFLIKTVQAENLQNRIIVEVLESEGIDNFLQIKEIFQRITDAGLSIAIDDFGIGYSNFAYIVNLPVSIIKIDGSLIKNITTDNSSKIIVQSIVMFAHELGLKTVAEFVSDKEIFEMTQSLGIDLLQGYYVGKPESEPLLIPDFQK